MTKEGTDMVQTLPRRVAPQPVVADEPTPVKVHTSVNSTPGVETPLPYDRLTPADADKQAYTKSLESSSAEQATWLLDRIGPQFTAAAVGVRAARTVRGWSTGGSIRDTNESERLRLLYRLVLAISFVYEDRAVAAGFLRMSNPYLNDEAPLVLLANNTVDDVQKPLISALRAFLVA